jgi:hypothetical protein
MPFTKDELELLEKKTNELTEDEKVLYKKLKARVYMKTYRAKQIKEPKIKPEVKIPEVEVKKINQVNTVNPLWYINLLKDHPKFKVNSDVYIQYRAYDEKQIVGLFKILEDVLFKVFKIKLTENTKSIITSIYRGKNVEVGKYKTNLEQLKTELKIFNIYNISKTIDKIKEIYRNANTLQNKLRPFVNLLARIDSFEKSYQILTNFNISLKNKYIQEREDNDDSDEEIEKLSHIMEIYNPSKLDETDNLIQNSSLNIRDKLLASFYLLMAPRRLEYRFLKLIKNGYDIEKLSDKFNYIVVDKDDIPTEIIFKRYKTARAGGKVKRQIYGTQKYNLNKYIVKYLIQYINESNISIDDMLFDIPLSTFSKLVGDIMNNLFKYQNINATTIRKIGAIYNQQNPSKSLKEKKKTATDMGHSLTENTLYNKIVKK